MYYKKDKINDKMKKVLDCRLGDLSEKHSCSPKNSFIIGRIFYARYKPILSFENSERKIVLIEDYSFIKSKLLFFWIILILCVLISIIGSILFNRHKIKGFTETDETPSGKKTPFLQN